MTQYCKDKNTPPNEPVNTLQYNKKNPISVIHETQNPPYKLHLEGKYASKAKRTFEKDQ